MLINSERSKFYPFWKLNQHITIAECHVFRQRQKNSRSGIKESLLLTTIAVAKISSLAYTASSSSKTQKATWRNQVTSGHAVEMCLRKGNLSLGIQVFNNR